MSISVTGLSLGFDIATSTSIDTAPGGTGTPAEGDAGETEDQVPEAGIPGSGVAALMSLFAPADPAPAPVATEAVWDIDEPSPAGGLTAIGEILAGAATATAAAPATVDAAADHADAATDAAASTTPVVDDKAWLGYITVPSSGWEHSGDDDD
jgi:hypothetical protein